ncbi:hypothetical protein [Crocosphaera sp. XPORK-15E]|uniref:hypothetical protein n=1 Tax=Crocosphaera sp. XPORK-15E TaxID=3110247 RepID=UPI002B20B865|nr:hypothetical protein [Crocosphaera sp. XPORK-15E]MEA5533343.1 hypothetical protein [Crocosphaera sp. XPORK-15E]
MTAQPREIRRYVTNDGKIPFAQWLDSLRDIKAKTKIAQRLNRVSLGNLGDHQNIGKIIGDEKMPTSDSYHDSLIESLKDSHYAAVYLETHLETEEHEFEPELLKLALTHVLEALGSQVLTPEQMTIQVKNLEQLMKKSPPEAINDLAYLLKSLGLKLTVKVDPQIQENNQTYPINQVKITV